MHDMNPKYTPSSHQKKNLDVATLVDQLNTLLTSLNLPIHLISPTDLTPSLLIAILESILGMRIPFIDRDKESKSSKTSKVQDMKVFLGVLETDILKMDVGLSDLDPRRLADGEWEEVLFIAELLCWIGRRMGFIKKAKKQDETCITPRQNLTLNPNIFATRSLSPKSQLDLDAASVFQAGSTVTGSTRHSQRTLSPFVREAGGESVTSLNTGDHHDEYEGDDDALSSVSDVLSALPPFTKSQLPPPHCIHEVPSPSLLFSRDISLASPSPECPSRRHSLHDERGKKIHDSGLSLAQSSTIEESYATDQSVPIRYTGYIEPVDEDSELASFESSRSISFSGNRSRQKNKPRVSAESVKGQYARTLELLNERARLLTQLEELKTSHG